MIHACNNEFVKKKHCRDLRNDGPKHNNTNRAAIDTTRVGLAQARPNKKSYYMHTV